MSGVPHLLQQKWRAVRGELQKHMHLNPFTNRVLWLDIADEASVAPLLERLAEEWGSEVAIGSYPVSSGVQG